MIKIMKNLAMLVLFGLVSADCGPSRSSEADRATTNTAVQGNIEPRANIKRVYKIYDSNSNYICTTQPYRAGVVLGNGQTREAMIRDIEDRVQIKTPKGGSYQLVEEESWNK